MASQNEAVYWLARLRRGALTEEERARFDAWRSQADHAAALAAAERLWQAIGLVAASPQILQERERILARISRRRVLHRIAVAASLSIAVIGLFALAQHGNLFRSAWHSVAEDRFTTAVGQRSRIELSDGSILTLDTDSTATAAFDKAERTVSLLRGQAMFEVAKNQPRPFIVYAGQQRIVATGTAFDVRLGRTAVEVTLIEGHVIVDQAAANPELRSRPSHSLSAGQRLVARTGESVQVSAANLQQVTSWTGGKLVFIATRLADAVEESNRYTHHPISLGDGSLADLRIDGVFRADQPAEFAHAVAQIYPVNVSYLPDGQIRIAKKD